MDEEAHQLLAPVNRLMTSTLLQRKPNYRLSAVGILCYEKNNSIHCILIQRPKYEGVHGNQISFPGGKMDHSDETYEYTARRECFEEINLPINAGIKIADLSDIYIPVSNFLVKPVVFTLHQEYVFTPDKREVDEILSFDLFRLLENDVIQSKKMELKKGTNQINVPYFNINEKVVWGATAMILSELRSLLQRF